jgi:hypothetical protein
MRLGQLQWARRFFDSSGVRVKSREEIERGSSVQMVVVVLLLHRRRVAERRRDGDW